MTTQIPDAFLYKDEYFQFLGFENPNHFFRIADLGINPKPISTACWRGYVALFSIDKDGRLVLKELQTTFENELPTINGIDPKVIIREHNEERHEGCCRFQYSKSFGHFKYSDLNILINYNGRIIITDCYRFTSERWLFTEFYGLYPIEKVIELSFINGEFICKKTRVELENEFDEQMNGCDSWWQYKKSLFKTRLLI